MNYYSTNNKNQKVSLREAVIQGLAPDNGLYMPEEIPGLPRAFFKSLQDRSLAEIAYYVSKAIVGDDLPESELIEIVDHTIQFDAPLVPIESGVHALELFHGPTLAFKDFGARFLSGLLGYFAEQQNKEITILVATSGDTGSAVANAFLHVPGTRVVVLYPSGKVSEVQEKQFTTLGNNIIALEVSGSFDDCQQLVKQAFLDEQLKKKLFLTSANSINIARLIPQMFYYFYAYAQIDSKKPVVISVPSGNFGNLTAGLMAKKMGLGVNKFVAATNVNDVVPEYLKTKIFEPRKSKQTISNAMDVGNPSNFVRIVDLYQSDFEKLSSDIVGYSYSDKETHGAMRLVSKQSGYTMDPHGAIGYLGLKDFMTNNPGYSGIFLETAHPAKFKEVVDEAIGHEIKLPHKLKEFMKGKKQSISIASDFEAFKKLLPTLFP
jgi:threonine synthase